MNANTMNLRALANTARECAGAASERRKGQTPLPGVARWQ